jgi:hypothetical protein
MLFLISTHLCARSCLTVVPHTTCPFLFVQAISSNLEAASPMFASRDAVRGRGLQRSRVALGYGVFLLAPTSCSRVIWYSVPAPSPVLDAWQEVGAAATAQIECSLQVPERMLERTWRRFVTRHRAAFGDGATEWYEAAAVPRSHRSAARAAKALDSPSMTQRPISSAAPITARPLRNPSRAATSARCQAEGSATGATIPMRRPCSPTTCLSLPRAAATPIRREGGWRRAGTQRSCTRSSDVVGSSAKGGETSRRSFAYTY